MPSYTPKYDDDLANAQPFGPPRNSFPFELENNTVMLEQDYWQKAAHFSPVALDTEHPNHNGFYLVHEGPRHPVHADIVQWTRFYTEIPEQRSEYQSAPYTLPELRGNEAAFVKPIQGGAANANAAFTDLQINGHGYSAGEGLSILYYVTQNASGSNLLFFTRRKFRVVEAVPNANYVVVSAIDETSNATFQSVFSLGSNRKGRTEKVNCRIQFDYYLPGVTANVATPSDIPILSPTRPVDGYGNDVDYYSDSTSPSQANYLANTVGTEVVLEESTLRVWRGNIYERQTPYAVAK